ELDILSGTGISREGGLIDLGVEQGIVRKSGAWYTYEGDQLGQGKENARTFLQDNPDLANEIEKKIKEKLGVGPRVDADPAAGGGPGTGNLSVVRDAAARGTPRSPAWPAPPAVSGKEAADAGGGGPDPHEAAREICLRLLAAAPRTRAQLASALHRRRVPDEVAEDLLGRLADVRLIDDAAFAR